MDQVSDISHHFPHSKITSGALYYLVLIILEWCSLEKVAPPKSIIFISLFVLGPGTHMLFTFSISSYLNNIFSGFKSVCVNSLLCINPIASKIYLKKLYIRSIEKPLYPFFFIISNKLGPNFSNTIA